MDDRELRLSMLGKLWRARAALEHAVAAIESTADPVVAENLTIAAGYVAEAQIQWRDRQR